MVKYPGLYLERALAEQRKLGEELFALLLGPLAQGLEPGQRLVIAPDGLLYYLPFETLRHRRHYLIEDHEISYAPSASVLKLLQQASEKHQNAAQMELLAFGDPAFGPSATGKSGQPGRSQLGGVMGRLWGNGNDRVPVLPRTRAEILAISKLFPPEQRSIFLGRQATEEAVKREPLNRYRRIHFATHSLIDERFPARSGVLLTLDANPTEDGFLDAGEIAELKLDCELVVLSACQTGRGQLVSGEGLVGLARAFLYAGARAIAVSLWNVSDLSTEHLMTDFYRHLAAHENAATALRQAKLKMLRSRQAARHPYYWAPFVLVGHPR